MITVPEATHITVENGTAITVCLLQNRWRGLESIVCTQGGERRSLW